MSSFERTIALLALFFLAVVIIAISYFNFVDQSIFSFFKNEEKNLRRISISYEVSDYNKVLELGSDFLFNYPQSKNKNKILIKMAESFLQKKDFDRTRKYLREIFDSKEIDALDYSDAAIVLGKVARETEAYDTAAVNYLESAFIKANEAKRSEIANYLGYLYLYGKDYQGALKYFSQGSGELSIIGQSRVYIEKGDYPGAIREYLNFFNAYPKGVYFEAVKSAFLKQSLYYAEKLEEAKSYSEALNYLSNVVFLFPRDPSSEKACIEIVDIYNTKKEYAHALSYLNRAMVNSSSQNELVFYKKGLVLYEMNQKKKALEVFQKLKEQFPDRSYSKKSDEWIELISKEFLIENTR
jgi:tetratricopeptide (TPR) repeat protein